MTDEVFEVGKVHIGNQWKPTDDFRYMPGSWISTGKGGVVECLGHGMFRYHPAKGFVGIDTFPQAILAQRLMVDDWTPANHSKPSLHRRALPSSKTKRKWRKS